MWYVLASGDCAAVESGSYNPMEKQMSTPHGSEWCQAN
jgi:hypothetical protein